MSCFDLLAFCPSSCSSLSSSSSSFSSLTLLLQLTKALLTVRETFQYAASLRISNATYEQKMEAAENLIKLLGLEKCADGIVGNEDNRGISGGEKRRVSIGVDIVHQPAVIFLDEPTR